MAVAQQLIAGELVVTPNPFTPNYKILVRRDNTAGITSIYYSEDGGTTWNILIPAPTSKNKPGQILTLGLDGQVSWQFPAISSNSGGSGTLPAYVDMRLEGELSLNQIFGYFKVSAGLSLSLTEIQLSIQTAADSAVQVDVVNGSGMLQGRIATISANQKQSSTVLATPLHLPSGTIWSLKVLSIGATSPGEALSARLVLTTAAN